jgi:hypothetical protein
MDWPATRRDTRDNCFPICTTQSSSGELEARNSAEVRIFQRKSEVLQLRTKGPPPVVQTLWHAIVCALLANIVISFGKATFWMKDHRVSRLLAARGASGKKPKFIGKRMGIKRPSTTDRHSRLATSRRARVQPAAKEAAASPNAVGCAHCMQLHRARGPRACRNIAQQRAVSL